MIIDLNADLGEGCASDSALLQLVSSANIACGFHAGDALLMHKCVREALKNGVAVGAHPSFPDRENFGRTAMQLPPETVYAQMLYQIGALAAIVRAEGGELKHVKPHGMLYNQAAKEAPLADAIARAVRDFDPALILVGLAGSELIRAGQHYKLVTRQEVFADRGYLADGSLVPRSQPGAKSRRWRRPWMWCGIIGYAGSPVNGRMLSLTPCVFTVTVNMRWILRAVCVRLLPDAIFRSARKQKNKTIIIKALQHSQQHSQLTGRYHGRSDISLAADRHCRDCGRICFAF